MTKKNTFIVLACISLLGAFLRLYQLSSMPAALNWDEISHGYNALSVLKTGSDEWGARFPLANFRAYGDYPLTLNLYLTIPFIATLGLNAFSIRLPHALLGIGTIIATYFLVTAVTKKRHIGLISAFLVSIEPWYVFTSRFVLQSNVSVFLLTSAMAAFFNRKSHKLLLPLSIFLLGLSLYAYNTTRIFTPLLLLGMITVYKKELFSKASLLIALLFFLPLPFILANPNARARSNEVFLLNAGATAKIENLRNTSELPPLLSKLMYNRPAYLFEQSFIHYVDYFSPQFLFISGGTQYQFSVPDHGVLYFVTAPFFYLGLLIVIYRALKKREKVYLVLLLWILLAPLPAIITTERFAVLRSTSLLPLPSVLSAIGFFAFLTYIRKYSVKTEKWIYLLFIGALFVCAFLYLQKYGGEYRQNYSWTWQYGYEDVVGYMKDHYAEYDRFIVTKKYGEPHEFVLFYNSWDPSSYKKDPSLVRYTQSNWWWVDSFDKYVFVNDWQIPKKGYLFITERKALTDCSTIRCLLVSSEGNAPDNWRKIKTVTFLDGKNAFELYENK